MPSGLLQESNMWRAGIRDLSHYCYDLVRICRSVRVSFNKTEKAVFILSNPLVYVRPFIHFEDVPTTTLNMLDWSLQPLSSKIWKVCPILWHLIRVKRHHLWSVICRSFHRYLMRSIQYGLVKDIVIPEFCFFLFLQRLDLVLIVIRLVISSIEVKLSSTEH